MSGYKLSGMTQEQYQAALAFASYKGLDPDDPATGEAWEALSLPETKRWLAVAAAVRDDTRTEPRW